MVHNVFLVLNEGSRMDSGETGERGKALQPPLPSSQAEPRMTADPLGFHTPLGTVRASLVAQMVKNLPAMQEMWVRSLGWEAPLEEGMATHSSVLAGESHGQRRPWESRARHD